MPVPRTHEHREGDTTIVTLIPEAEQSYPHTSQHQHHSISHYANLLFAGLGHGGLFLFTNTAGAMKLIHNKPASIVGGLAIGACGGFSNMSQAPQATRQLFNWPPRKSSAILWFFTLACFFTIGGYATLPLVAAVLQATKTIEEKTGIGISKINPVLGNLALTTTGVVYSVGLVNQLFFLTALVLWRVFKQESFKFALMKKFVNSQRSTEELELFNAAPERFQEIQFSKSNMLASFLGLFPGMILAWNISPEISKILHQKNTVPLLKALAPIESMVNTTAGSRIISLLTIGLLNAAFAQDGIRTIPRDFYALYTSEHKPKLAAILAAYTLYILCTCFTSAFQSIESNDSIFAISLTMISVFIMNWPGARPHLFETAKEKELRLTAIDKISEAEKEIENRPRNQHVIFQTPSDAALNDANPRYGTLADKSPKSAISLCLSD